MTSPASHRLCRGRLLITRTVLGAVVVASTVAVGALPLPAVAAPQGGAVVSPARIGDDPLAEQAVQALGTLQRALTSRSAEVIKAYDQSRDRIATVVATRLELDPALMQAAWRRADLEHQQAMLGAFTQLGVPYRSLGMEPGVGFDCSGLTSYAWGFAGLSLQHQSSAQMRAAAPRTALTAQAGDLVQYPGHVMMWLGVDRAMVHAPFSGGEVEVETFSARRRVRYADPTG